MGNIEQKGLLKSFSPAVVIPETEQLSHVKRVLRFYNSCSEDKGKKNFKTYRLGEVEVYGQFDPDTNQLTGYGCLKIDGEMVFQGEFVNSLKNGYGVEYEKGKVVFEGNYLNDRKDGWGKTSTYNGQYCRDKRQGWGIEANSTGRYEGFWKNDHYEGMGAKSYSVLGPEEVLDFLLQNQTSSEAPSCDMYIGEWKEGQRNGVGKLKTSKESYQGEFVNDMYHGQGTLFVGNVMRKGIFDRGRFLSS